MRGICIDNKNPINPGMLESCDMIFEGEVYTVIGEKWLSKELFYSLSERNFGNNSAVYHSKRFIPLSKVDELVGMEEVEFFKHVKLLG